jgi:predicted TIM-barrel fold metal-dependent hydrolase
MMQGVKICDFHCHFPIRENFGFPDYPEHVHPQFTSHGAMNQGEIWRKAFDFPPSEPATTDREMADKWARDMDEKGVEKVVFVSGGGNERLSNIVKMYPDKFLGFAHNHPEGAHAAEELEHGLRDLGLKGYKILGPDVYTPFSDKKFDPLWEICQQYQVPVLIHFGLLGAAGGTATGVNYSPLSIADVALRFPKLNFVVPHFGCTCVGDLLQLCWTRPNVWVDSSGSNQWIRWMPYKLSLEDVMRKFIETVGTGRLIFATDSSWFPRGFAKAYLEEQNRTYRFLGCTEEQMKDILYRNAAYLLKIEM